MTHVLLAIATTARGGSKLGKDGRDEIAVVDGGSLGASLAVHGGHVVAALNVFGSVRCLEPRHEFFDGMHRVVDCDGLGHVSAVLLGELVEFRRSVQGLQVAAGPFPVDLGKAVGFVVLEGKVRICRTGSISRGEVGGEIFGNGLEGRLSTAVVGGVQLARAAASTTVLPRGGRCSEDFLNQHGGAEV